MDLTVFDPTTLAIFIAVGFAAQLVDGALGMAFGVISNTLLLSLGVPPAAASAGVHAVETATTAVSGISHTLHKNVDWKMFLRLAIPGVIGGICGAYLLSNVDASAIKPFILIYLTLIGVNLIYRSRNFPPESERGAKVIEPLGLFGGFMDAAGGGGWGPIVTSNLLVQGTSPRKTIGTVNTAEFFLTTTISITFLTQLGWEVLMPATVGLLIGGVLAAPLGAILAKRVQPRILLLAVGIIVVLTSLYGIYNSGIVQSWFA